MVKRKHHKAGDDDVKFTNSTIVVKSTFCHLLSKFARKGDIREVLYTYLLQCNQLRFLSSVVIKRFWIRLLGAG